MEEDAGNRVRVFVYCEPFFPEIGWDHDLGEVSIEAIRQEFQVIELAVQHFRDGFKELDDRAGGQLEFGPAWFVARSLLHESRDLKDFGMDALISFPDFSDISRCDKWLGFNEMDLRGH